MVAKWCKGLALLLTLCIVGCSGDEPSACEQYPDVCAELESQSPVNIIVTLAMGADEEAFTRWLDSEGITVLASFEATGQLLLEVDKSEFTELSKQEHIEKIQKDKFYPR